MRVPAIRSAAVPREKIEQYLLSATHRAGCHKAAFFGSFGFYPGRWEVLAEALVRHASEHKVAKVEPSPSGTRYVVEGIIHAPDGRTPRIRSVWFIEAGEQNPRFVTAYPLKRGRK